MIVGAHARNEGYIPDSDVEKFKEGRFTGALLPFYLGPRAAGRLGCRPEDCVVRLPDTEYVNWVSKQKYLPSFRDYARDCVEVIESFYEEGYRFFQVDNEPNLVWPAHGYTHWDYIWYMEQVIPLIRQGLAERGIKEAKLGTPPLSMPTEHMDWWDGMTRIRSMCDWLSLHCYWQAGSHIDWDQFGGQFYWAAKTMYEDGEELLPIYITEAGNSSCQAASPPDRATLQGRMREQYPLYLKLCERGRVEGVYFFILGSNGDWSGFEFDMSVCRAIGARPHGGGIGGPLGRPAAS